MLTTIVSNYLSGNVINCSIRISQVKLIENCVCCCEQTQIKIASDKVTRFINTK